MNFKKATILSIAVTALFIGAILVANNQRNNYAQVLQQVITRPKMLQSTRSMEICYIQTDAGTGIAQTHCTTYLTKQTLNVNPQIGDDIVVQVIYESVDITKTTLVDGNEVSNETTPYEEQDTDLVYRVVLSGSGVIKSLQQTAGYNFEQGVRLTEKLITQTFPDIKAAATSKFLRQSGQEQIHQGHLGDLIPEYDIEDQGEVLVVKKTYDQDSFVDFKYSLGGDIPSIEYSSEIVINKVTGIPESSEYNYSFKLDETSQMTAEEDRELISHDDRPNVYEEILGAMDVSINQVVETQEIAYDAKLIEELEQHQKTHQFVTVDLRDDQGQLEVLESNVEEQEIMLAETAVHTKVWDVFKKSILGQTVAVGVEWNNYEEYSIIDANIWLNNKKLFTMYSTRLNHPWLACNSYNTGINQDKTWQIFKVTYPIAGIITIPVSASLGIAYGYNFSVAKSNGLCNINLVPYLKPLIEGKGGASIWKIAEAGVYGRGYVADTTITFGFQANVVNLSYGRLFSTVAFRPFSFEVGAYYWIIKCSLKKLFTFKWKNICSKGKEHRIQFAKDMLGGPINKTIFDYSITLKKLQ